MAPGGKSERLCRLFRSLQGGDSARGGSVVVFVVVYSLVFAVVFAVVFICGGGARSVPEVVGPPRHGIGTIGNR